LSRAVKADEISVVESTQPLHLARQSKNKKRLGLLSQPLFEYLAKEIERMMKLFIKCENGCRNILAFGNKLLEST